ncbi:GGDEF domain-containing protein [Thermus sediminis]|uniref:GGDEF domain-containing protein n=1 Tax=Thermus sediminis TaxID=1761908 RepID=UPI000E3CA5D3|nr:GGDEF domain-containing protein [Thermus sediminis]
MDLVRSLYGLTWLGLLLGIGVQLHYWPIRDLRLLPLYLAFALLFLLALRQGPKRAPRVLVHALGAYLLFEAWRSGEAYWGAGFWSPALYLLAAFAYPLPWALGAGAFWGGLLVLLPLLAGRDTGFPYGHYALSQPILLALTLLLARFRELYGQVRFWREQALTCPLTGLPNRRALEMALEREAARVERGERPFALVLLDLDDFKRVNDERGHQEGDRVLRRVAGYLKAHVRQGDLVGRWGGEEFAILLPATDPLGAERLAERLREGLAALGVTASFGVALYRGDLGELFLRADQALYRAKALGKNRVARASEPDTPPP